MTRILPLALLAWVGMAGAMHGIGAADCEGPHADQALSLQQMSLILAEHSRWLADNLGKPNPDYRDPRRANLCRANIRDMNLAKANLSKASLAGADLGNSDLSGASLVGADLNHAILIGTDLGNAALLEADLSHAFMHSANLAGAKLDRAILRDADLFDANLSEARLRRTDLARSDLLKANLRQATWEPVPAALPDIDSLSTASGLESLDFVYPTALVRLKNAFREAGYRGQEREITFALHRGENRRQLTKQTDRARRWEALAEYVLFDLTTRWGMQPERALLILLTLVFVFFPFYLAAVMIPDRDGIWKHWSNERSRRDLGSGQPELIKTRGPGAVGVALYFSLLSAFHVGWRDLNVGNWIARVQPREYTLHASGWARSISGLQSLISVYLVAIWALTYFGRPFE